jgi:hypothetical protein
MSARILYAWELGANLGHIGQFMPLARRLKAGGAVVECALTFTAGAARLLTPEGLGWLQAPVFRGKPPAEARDPPLSYAGILLLLGYGTSEDLLGLTGAWRRLIELSGATLVLADHSPTAILAARTLGVPVMLHGTGFYAPPPLSPTPAMRPWESTPGAILAASEQIALTSINTVLAAYGAPPLARVAELFEVAETRLNTFPELDPYGPREGGRYWGIQAAFAAPPLTWPPGQGPRIFGYLRAGFPGSEAALTALCATRCRAYICCPDAPADWSRRFAAPHVTIAKAPVDLEQASREADAAILYAPHSTTAALLRAGVPTVLIPQNLEQGLVAWKVQAMGAGYMVAPQGRFAEPGPALHALLTSADCRTKAMAFARKYAQATPASVVEAMATRALELAGPVGKARAVARRRDKAG